MNRHAIAFLVLVCTLLTFSCHPKPGELHPATFPSLINHRWLVKTIHQKDKPSLTRDKAIPELIIRLDSTYHGFGGCNQYSGTLVLGEGYNQGKISFGNAISTKMYCLESSALENAWFQVLALTDHWKTEGDQLYLYQGKRLLAALEAWYE
jgi:heat shock protein HslJ